MTSFQFFASLAFLIGPPIASETLSEICFSGSFLLLLSWASADVQTAPSRREVTASGLSPRWRRDRRWKKLFIVQVKLHRHDHAGVHGATTFAAGAEFPFRDGGECGGFEFAMVGFDDERIDDVPVGVHDELDRDVAGDALPA